MRLTSTEITTLKKSLQELDKDAELYLFGSRIDDNKRGGDIDLLIISKKLNKRDIRKIKFDFYDKFGEQKIDIIIDRGELDSPFKKIIFQKAIRL